MLHLHKNTQQKGNIQNKFGYIAANELHIIVLLLQ